MPFDVHQDGAGLALLYATTFGGAGTYCPKMELYVRHPSDILIKGVPPLKTPFLGLYYFRGRVFKGGTPLIYLRILYQE